MDTNDSNEAKYLLCNISLRGNSIDEEELDRCLKEIPYGSKISYGKAKADYNLVMVPIPHDIAKWKGSFLLSGTHISMTGGSIEDLAAIYASIGDFLDKATQNSFSIDIVDRIGKNSIDILYTDGSFRKADSSASYACCRLNSDKISGEVLLEEYTGTEYRYNAYSGKIDNATNNVGELTAIKVASKHFGNNRYQLIISDSEYSIKCFREWYHSWKDKMFTAYNGAPVKNVDLIKETYNSLYSKGKTVLLKWTKGHAGNAFNEKCDELAKNELNIKK